MYAYFNNDWEGYAIHNAVRMQELLGVAPYASRGIETARSDSRTSVPAS